MQGVNHWVLRARQVVADPKATAVWVLTRLSRSLRPVSIDQAAYSSLEEIVLAGFYDDAVGSAFKIDRKTKSELIESFKLATSHIPSGTDWLYHVVLAQEILKVPPTI